jgi:hypothetical protein
MQVLDAPGRVCLCRTASSFLQPRRVRRISDGFSREDNHHGFLPFAVLRSLCFIWSCPFHHQVPKAWTLETIKERALRAETSSQCGQAITFLANHGPSCTAHCSLMLTCRQRVLMPDKFKGSASVWAVAILSSGAALGHENPMPDAVQLRGESRFGRLLFGWKDEIHKRP